MTGVPRRASRLLFLALITGLLALAAACLVWTVAQARLRPPEYAEACLLFNAARMRAGLPLYVDPAIGAYEYGSPPARFFVAYTPLYTTALALLPQGSALAIARAASAIAWLGSLSVHTYRALPRCREQALLGAAFAASVFVFARWSACAKGDAFALTLAGVALARALARGRADAVAGCLFACAFLLKPSVMGAGVGVIAASTWQARERRWAAVGAAAAVVAVFVGVLEIASGGVAVRHMRAALGLAFSPRLFFDHLLGRAPIVAGLLAGAALSAWPARSSASARIALAALAASTCFAFAGLGKFGGSSAYLLEPALVAVVVLGHFPLLAHGTRGRSWFARAGLAGAVVCSVGWSSIATVRSLVEERALLPQLAPALARVRARCIDGPGDMIVSSDPGIELAVAGRIYTYPIEMWNEAREGRFPEQLWASDVTEPSVRCVVTWIGDGAAPASPAGLFPPPVIEAMKTHFVLEGSEGPYAIYRARSFRRSR